MRKALIYVNMLVWSIISNGIFAAEYPLIFLHGHKSLPKPSGSDGGWATWNNPKSAMIKIINQGYGGYTARSPRDCHENTTLTSTGGNARKIYNFSYYHPDGTQGAIGSNGRLECEMLLHKTTGQIKDRDNIDPGEMSNYVDVYGSVLAGGSWAENFALFIGKVLEACYGNNWPSNSNAKVDIVAHSMGGLVARSAIKYYEIPNPINPSNPIPVKEKVRKLLMIGTPNHPYGPSLAEWFYDRFGDDKPWQKVGEDWEMGCDRGKGTDNIKFRDINSWGEKPFAEFSDVTPSGTIATIPENKEIRSYSLEIRIQGGTAFILVPDWWLNVQTPITTSLALSLTFQNKWMIDGKFTRIWNTQDWWRLNSNIWTVSIEGNKQQVKPRLGIDYYTGNKPRYGWNLGIRVNPSATKKFSYNILALLRFEDIYSRYKFEIPLEPRGIYISVGISYGW